MGVTADGSGSAVVKERDDYHIFVMHIPDVLWEKLCEESVQTNRPITGIIAETVQKRYGVHDSELPPPKRSGRPPKRKQTGRRPKKSS